MKGSKKVALGIVVVLLGVVSSMVLYSVVARLQDQIGLLEDENTQLDANYRSVQVQIALLQGRFTQLEGNYIDLQDKYAQLEANSTSLQDRYIQLQADYKALNYQLNPSLTTTFWRTQSGQVYGVGSGIDYIFNVTGTGESFQIAPSEVISEALAPLVGCYPFVTSVRPNGLTAPFWMSQYIGGGQFSFTLRIETELTDEQLQTLTRDLTDALKTTQ